MKKVFNSLFVLVIILLICTGCQTVDIVDVPTAMPVVTEVVTTTEEPTATIEPTSTVESTEVVTETAFVAPAVVTPTSTPKPTATAIVTPTAAPTVKPTAKPTATPTPEVTLTTFTNNTVFGKVNVNAATVTLSNDQYIKTAIVKNNSYVLSDIPEGTYTVKVEAPGYAQSNTTTVSVVSVEEAKNKVVNKSLNFSLEEMKTDGYYFTWELNEANYNTEVSANIVEKINVEFLDTNVNVVDLGYASLLRDRYNVVLSNNGEAWSTKIINRFFELYTSLPNEVLENTKSVWTLTNEEQANDISFTKSGDVWNVKLSVSAVANSTPRVASINGQTGSYYSKRLYHAIIRFVTNNGKNAEKCEKILTTNFCTSFNVDDYAKLTAYTTQETANSFQEFYPEEKLLILMMFEEMPTGMHKTPELKYVVRRRQGTSNPIYTVAPAVAWSLGENSYIEFMEAAFDGDAGYNYSKSLILHEKMHIYYSYYFSDNLKAKWNEVGGWYETTEDEDGWATTHQTDFVSGYANTHNPNEDLAESCAAYINDPNKLLAVAPAKYEFIKNYIMHGTLYTIQTRTDLTFEVFNLDPDYVFPGQIKKIEVSVIGKAEEDKTLTIKITLVSGNKAGAEYAYLRLMSEHEDRQLYDMYLYKTDASGFVLKGSITISKYSIGGYWFTDQITLTDSVGNKRYETQADYMLKAYFNNPLGDTDDPKYVKGSIKLKLENANNSAHPTAQNLIVTFSYSENIKLASAVARLYCIDSIKNSIDVYAETEDINHRDQTVTVKIYISEYYSTGKYMLAALFLTDVAGNETYVGFDQEEYKTNDVYIDIITTNPDEVGPEIDINNIIVSARPTVPSCPNGETAVTVKFKIKDNLSGSRYGYIDIIDPQGNVRGYFLEINYTATNYFVGNNATVATWYTFSITLPKGSLPGIWGIYEIRLFDYALNVSTYNFTEIMHFDIQ